MASGVSSDEGSCVIFSGTVQNTAQQIRHSMTAAVRQATMQASLLRGFRFARCDLLLMATS